MKITTCQALEKSCYYIGLYGELDACSSLLLDEAIDKAIREQPREIQIDCQELYYISSAGLGVFVSYLETLSQQNIFLVLHHLNPKVKSTFDSIRLLSANKTDLVLNDSLHSVC